MRSTWFSYRSRWQGMEWECTPEQFVDGLWVHLLSQQPLEDFEEVVPGVHIRLVSAAECDMVAHVTMVCEWRGEPFVVLDERTAAGAEDLLLEYTGGKVPRAHELGLERIERGVYRGWVPREEVRGLREDMTMLVAPKL